ncbi:MAG TPA: PEGA domain-containing protein [Gaiellaceae bacterium]|nr:PEGA domain-containing protein [Gaiellaceae bacterium]
MTWHARAALGALAAMLATSASRGAWAGGDEQQTARPAQADDAKKEAQQLFEQALKQAESGDARAALGSFRGAYEKYPSFRVLYNIAQICTRLDDAACTLRAYERYLRDGGADVPAKRRAEVEGQIQVLRRKIATVTITSNTAGAEIWIDDERIGRTPLPGPTPVNAGPHSVRLVHEDQKVERTVDIAGLGESITIELEVPKAEPAAEAKAAEPAIAAKSAAPAERPFPVVPWAVTGGFAVATAVTGVLAATSYASFEETRDRFGITKAELDDAQASARNLLLLTGLFGTITIASASVAGYFTFLARPSTTTAAPAAPAARLGLGPRGVVFAGTWP